RLHDCRAKYAISSTTRTPSRTNSALFFFTHCTFLSCFRPSALCLSSSEPYDKSCDQHNSRYAKDHKETEGSRVLYCIVLSLKALRLDRKVLDTVKVCRNGIHEYLRILELRKCICDLRID